MESASAKKGAASDRGFHRLRIAVALVLLAAAAAKCHQYCTEPILGTGILSARWFLIGVVECESLFSLWLLAGILPKVTWTAALTCFSAFACVSLWKGLAGETTCQCFGAVLPLNPWYTATLDLAIVASLLRWRPREPLFAANIRQVLTRAVAVLVIWLSVGVPAAYAMGSYTDTTLSDAGEVIGNGKIVVLRPET